MSGFNTKERNNNGEYEITFYTDNHEDFKKVQDLCRNLIGHGKPVSTEGDLISRSALKTELEVYRHTRNYKSDEDEAQNALLDNILEDIDNAQAVDLWQMRQEATENALKKAEVLYARPKGEWLFKHNSSDIWCSVCDENFDEIPQAFNFCPNCGADMRGGAE